MTRVPDRVANLRANPAATVIVRRRRILVQAEELDGEAYDQARTQVERQWRGVPGYERMSGRRVPYFRLIPTESGERSTHRPSPGAATE
jgi:hypothetical protein